MGVCSHDLSEASILVLQDLRWSICPYREPKSREMPLKDRISPVRNTYFAHPLPFLPDLLTPILSVRSVILLGHCEEERCRSGRQEALGPPRRSWGQYLILSRYGQMWVRVRSLGCAAQPPLLGWRRNMCTLPVSIFCTTWFIGFWFMTVGHALTCAVVWFKTQKHRLLVSHWYDNEGVTVCCPIETFLLTSALSFYWCISHGERTLTSWAKLFKGCV